MVVDEFRNKRLLMVEKQIIGRGIKDERVIELMRVVPRHIFVPVKFRDLAYDDRALPISYGQTISQPYMVALMMQELKLTGDEKVLEVGTGSGYNTLLLSKLTRDVYTIDRIFFLVEEAVKRLKAFDVDNVSVKVGDGSCGWDEFAPYDRIIVSAGSPSLPQVLLSQLSDNSGKLVIPIGDKTPQLLTKFEKFEGKVDSEIICECSFVKLIGKYGWKE